MDQYRYRLEAKGNQHLCPGCGQKTFSRYIDSHTNHHLDDKVGLCNRRDKCGYHLPPREFFRNCPDKKPLWSNHTIVEQHKNEVIPGIPIDPQLCRKTLSNYLQNHFVLFLKRIYPDEIVQKLVGIYSIGTAKNNRTVFWQIDRNDEIRRGKIILYSSETGKRDKVSNSTSSVHYELRIRSPQMPPCFFGEHLLTKFPNKPVAIFESEKTAIIAAAFFTDFVCLASGGKTGLNEEKCQALKGREVYLFPDIQAYELWCQKAIEYRRIVKLTVSDFLEKHSTEQERSEGLDIADYLVKHLLSNAIKTNTSNKFTQLTQPTQNVSYKVHSEKKESTPTHTQVQTEPILLSAPLPSQDKSLQKQKTIPAPETVFNPLYDYLRFSGLGKIQLLLDCPENKSANINLYLFYRLITAWNQDKIMELFSTSQYYPKEAFMDKLPDRWEFQDLKTDGISLIKGMKYNVCLYYKIWTPECFKHNGLLYYSLYKKDFTNKDKFSEAVAKVKSLQNVVLVYTSGLNSDTFLNFMVYCGELPNISGLAKDDMYYNCLDGYDARWTQYMKYVKRNIDLKNVDQNPDMCLGLDIDPDAWFNPNLETLLNWNQLVKKYELL